MFYLNTQFDKLGGILSDRDIAEIVPLELLHGDDNFFEYIFTSNERWETSLLLDCLGRGKCRFFYVFSLSVSRILIAVASSCELCLALELILIIKVLFLYADLLLHPFAIILFKLTEYLLQIWQERVALKRV